ncbi:MAG: efflux RND transporter periplasmic adaptor subunit [Psychrobacter sp.]|nr:efflux RND transporter periplasmic adaptor subunit [Psychrobacter sp.]
MKHPYLALMIAATLIGSGMTLTACDKKGADGAAGASAAQQMPPAVVNVTPVSFQTVPQIQTFSGRTTAYQTADVRPQVTGIIDEVLFREGREVKKGQPLYRISTENYSSSIQGGQASIEQAKAGLTTSQANYNNAIAELASRRATLAQTESDLNRLKGLVDINAISQQQYDQAITAQRTAQAAVQSAEAAIAQAQAGIESAKANILAAQSGLKASELDLSRTIVRAPISGRTDRSMVTAGALVSAGQPTPLVTISQLSPIYVDISQSSSDLLKLRQQIASGQAQAGGNTVELVLEDGSTYPVRGQLALSEAKVDEATGAVTLRAVFPNDNNILLPGMFVKARLVQSVITNAVLLPQSAIIRSPKGDTQVYVVDANKKIQVRPVKVNGTYESNWIITEGLKAGEQVVVIGGSKVKPDQEVMVKPLPPTTPEEGAPGSASTAAGQNASANQQTPSTSAQKPPAKAAN